MNARVSATSVTSKLKSNSKRKSTDSDIGHHQPNNNNNNNNTNKKKRKHNHNHNHIHNTSSLHKIRIMLLNSYEKPFVQFFFAVLIFCNFVLSAVISQVQSTSPSDKILFSSMETFFVVVFGAELAWNIAGSWFLPFWKNGWNVFDFCVVTFSIFAQLMPNMPGVVVFRLFRAFRVFRLSRRIKSLRTIVEAVVSSLPGVANAFVILMLLMGIWSITGVGFFQTSQSQNFGSFLRAMLTMWQVLTFDSWATALCWPLVEHQPLAAIFFISFVFIGAMVMSNVVAAVLIEKVMGSQGSDTEEPNMQTETSSINYNNNNNNIRASSHVLDPPCTCLPHCPACDSSILSVKPAMGDHHQQQQQIQQIQIQQQQIQLQQQQQQQQQQDEQQQLCLPQHIQQQHQQYEHQQPHRSQQTQQQQRKRSFLNFSKPLRTSSVPNIQFTRSSTLDSTTTPTPTTPLFREPETRRRFLIRMIQTQTNNLNMENSPVEELVEILTIVSLVRKKHRQFQ